MPLLSWVANTCGEYVCANISSRLAYSATRIMDDCHRWLRYFSIFSSSHYRKKEKSVYMKRRGATSSESPLHASRIIQYFFCNIFCRLEPCDYHTIFIEIMGRRKLWENSFWISCIFLQSRTEIIRNENGTWVLFRLKERR